MRSTESSSYDDFRFNSSLIPNDISALYPTAREDLVLVHRSSGEHRLVCLSNFVDIEIKGNIFALLTLCDGKNSVDEICEEIAVAFDEDAEGVRKAIIANINELRENSLIIFNQQAQPATKQAAVIEFKGFWRGFDPTKSVITHFLAQAYQVIIAENDAANTSLEPLMVFEYDMGLSVFKGSTRSLPISPLADSPLADSPLAVSPIADPELSSPELSSPELADPEQDFDESDTSMGNSYFHVQVSNTATNLDNSTCDYLITGAQCERSANVNTIVPMVLNRDIYESPAYNHPFFSDFRRPLKLMADHLIAAMSDKFPLDNDPETSLDATPKTPAEVATKVPRLTIGMACYKEFDNLYFTIQALRYFHREIADDIEIIIVNNDPEGKEAKWINHLLGSVKNGRCISYGERNTTASRDVIFREARSPFVLCIDSHIFMQPGSLKYLIDYYEANPDTCNLYHGPLDADDMKNTTSHMNPVWSSGMFGQFDFDANAADEASEPSKIPLHGLGIFSCRRDAWLGFNPRFYGFGGEEGYIHEKFRLAGHKTVLLPKLRWLHKFRSEGASTPYRNAWVDRVYNYTVGNDENGVNSEPMQRHFKELLKGSYASSIKQVNDNTQNPIEFFDAIYFVQKPSNPEQEKKEWTEFRDKFKKLGFETKLRRYFAFNDPYRVETPKPVERTDLSDVAHLNILINARKRNYKNVLILNENFATSDNFLGNFAKAIEHLVNLPWAIMIMNGDIKLSNPKNLAPYQRIADELIRLDEIPDYDLSAVAYNHLCFDALTAGHTAELTEADATQWLEAHGNWPTYTSHRIIDQRYCLISGK